MPRPKSVNDHQVAFKIPARWIAMADAIATSRSRGGFTTTRTEVLRAALKGGLERLELETTVDEVLEKRPRRRSPK